MQVVQFAKNEADSVFWNTDRFLADDWALVYNAASDCQDVAFGTQATASIRDEARFSRFLEMLNQESGDAPD
ncbi:MAG: hypothetical protein FJ276_14450 [Planctomycetes bacterium]|nr:hypothetical protein [Planctomycetota bacterium]